MFLSLSFYTCSCHAYPSSRKCKADDGILQEKSSRQKKGEKKKQINKLLVQAVVRSNGFSSSSVSYSFGILSLPSFSVATTAKGGLARWSGEKRNWCILEGRWHHGQNARQNILYFQFVLGSSHQTFGGGSLKKNPLLEFFLQLNSLCCMYAREACFLNFLGIIHFVYGWSSL